MFNIHSRGFRLIPVTAIRLLTLACLCLSIQTPAQTATLPAPVAEALKKHQIPQASVSIWVQAVDAKQPLIAFNGSTPMNPASVMKLVTAFASFENFGQARTWTTRLATDGTVSTDGATLNGNLYLIGSGDPVLSQERLWKLFRQLRTQGIRHIHGSIIIDASALRLPPYNPYDFDGRGLRPYNTGPYGALIHFSTLQLELTPGNKANLPVEVRPFPSLPRLIIDNQIKTGAGQCGIWYSQLDAHMDNTPDGQSRIVLTGILPAQCGPRSWGVAPLMPETFAIDAIDGLWHEIGGSLDGIVRAGVAPANTRPLAYHTSPSLAEIIREMNKWSSNVIARQLMALIGSSQKQSFDMVADGGARTRALFQATGIDSNGLVIENGAGLSRIERVSAKTLGQMLLTVWHRPYMPEYIAALPVAGSDGTARKLLKNSGANGYAHIKTGSINNVRAIAGYLLNPDGQRFVVVFMVNDARAHESRQALEALLDWVWHTTDSTTMASHP